ncbi:hypothetical protein LTR37_016324 [Vermiconidia calcicola]|uniref:Uncharacterized protein n=1 Tax=Vermiconidia calcicola TaxID=1690605 RepID=A0ACC3MPP5_9PEZI|nr:hypothetical protein LTR37_016324 [Vermiconidia calcicola]
MATTAQLDPSSYLDQEAFSDVTIKIGDRSIKCHKLILCHNSDYFKMICAPGSRFVETRSNIIELKDDNPQAAEAMLRYTYNLRYDDLGSPQQQTPKFHFDVCVVAEKYLLPALKQQALSGLQRLVNSHNKAQLSRYKPSSTRRRDHHRDQTAG